MAAADAPAGGVPTRLELPPESLHAMKIEKEHAKSVVRLRIHQAPPRRPGRGTGFIAVNTANRLVLMTCGHLFLHMVPGKGVDVTFYDGREATAKGVYADTQREVAVLLIDTSRASLSPDEISQYTAVNFSSEQNDVRKGDSLVMLGYPYSMPNVHKIGCFFGSVMSEAGLVVKSQGGDPVRMFGGDYGSGHGASGAPVFGSDGRVVGINVSGHQDTSFALSLPWIRDTLMTKEEVRNSKLANPTIKEMIELCYVHTPPRGHAGTGSSSAGGSDAPEASGRGGQGASA